MDRKGKEAWVASLNSELKNSEAVVVADYRGLTVAEMTDLRAKAREAGATIKVTKNRLTHLALKETDFDGLTDLFKGTTLVSYSEDPVAAAKALSNFAKENDKLKVLGGGYGTNVLDIAGVQSLASLPSLDELRGTIVALLQAPGGKIASVVKAPAGQMARVLNAFSQKAA